VRGRWSAEELADALALGEREFLEKHPGRNETGLRQRVEELLRQEGSQETYLQFRTRQDRQVAEAQRAPVTVKDQPTDEEYETYFSLLEDANAAKRVLSPTQESTEFTAPDPHLPVAIAFTGDWHCGAGGVRYDWLRRDLELIRDTEGVYAVGMGDWLEGVLTTTKASSALYSGLFNDGGSQEVYVVKRSRIAAGKWLAILSGNHDEWIYRSAGITRMDQLAGELGAPHFSQGGGTIFASVGDQRYVVGVRHNVAGNSRLNTTNAQRRAFDDWPEWDNCDLICVGHLHYNDLHIQPRRGGNRCVYLRSGTYKVIDGYARDNGFTPEWGVPLAILLPDERRVIAWRGDDFLEGLNYFRWLRAEYAAGRRVSA
jgi:hypothetical protein